jgi:N-acyl homoserine lactone hydrolase
MRLFLLQTALYRDGDNYAPFPAYIIQTDDRKNILIDSGYEENRAVQTRNAQGQQVLFIEEDEKLVNQLARIGLKPRDIDYVICTHFDEDHSGNHNLFTNAEFIVQQSHYELALSGVEQRFEISRASWDAPGLKYRLINGDCEILPGIEVIVTDGHVTGHQSVLVRLSKTGAVLLAIDAIRDNAMLKPNVDPRTVSMFDMDGYKLVEGVHKLQDIIKREKVQLVVFGHDWGEWKKLRHSPAYYD